MPVEVLKPHEQVIQKKVDQLERMTIRWDAYTKPLLVDGATGTILDGHHRFEIAKRLDLQCLPCVVVDYLCLLYTSPSPRDRVLSRMPSSA